MLSSLYRRSDSSNPPLRIGLLLDSTELLSCFAEVVDHIQESNFASLELLVFNAEEQEKAEEARPRQSLLTKAMALMRDQKRRKTLLFDLYQRLDRRRIAPELNPYRMVDYSSRLANIESFTVTPIRKRFVHRFPADAIERIRAKDLDVLIRFGFNILRGDILTSAKYGVWSYHHGDGDYYRGGPAHFWEVYEANPLSGAMLQVLTEDLDAGKVLYKGLFASYPGMSHMRNCVQPYWGASTFMIQKLRELHQYGWEHVQANMLPPAPYRGKKKIYTAPSNPEMFRWLAPQIARRSLRRLLARPEIKHWRLAVRRGAKPLLDSGPVPDLNGFRWIESPKGCFYADPFLLEQDGKHWIFFEEFDYAKRRGKICCGELQGNLIANPVTALERPYHVSYPCVLKSGHDLYMIPETASNGSIELYRCLRFPDRWQLERDLLKAKAVDTTVHEKDGLYWFFVTLQENCGGATQLWLFSAKEINGEWTPHPANPISTDVRITRGAGAILSRNGRLFRPSQDCSKHYGYSFSLNEIEVLNTGQYQERKCVTVDPIWVPGLIGTHTYSSLGEIEIIDGCLPLPPRRVSLASNREFDHDSSSPLTVKPGGGPGDLLGKILGRAG